MTDRQKVIEVIAWRLWRYEAKTAWPTLAKYRSLEAFRHEAEKHRALYIRRATVALDALLAMLPTEGMVEASCDRSSVDWPVSKAMLIAALDHLKGSE